MQNARLFVAIPFLLFMACEEGTEVVQNKCYLSEVTASNSETIRFEMEDDKLLTTSYGDVQSEAVYTYDASGKLLSIVNGSIENLYEYNAAGKVVQTQLWSDGEMVAKTEVTFDVNGFPDRLVATHNLQSTTPGVVETFLEYENGNPVKRTTYRYPSGAAEKGNALVTRIRYDNKANPYNTHNPANVEPVKNNPIEITYESDPENNTVISYSYNSKGYPTTYRYQYPNRTDGYPDVTGEYRYECK